MANAELILPLALPVMSLSGLGTAVGYDIANVGEELAGVVYKSAGGVAAGYIQLDFGVDVSVSRLMLFGIVGAPANATLKVYSSTNAQGATYVTQTATVLLYAGANRLVNGAGVAYLPITAPASRYWRIEFGALASAQLQIGRMVMGQHLALSRNFKFGGEFGIRSFASAEFSPRGIFLRRKGKKLRTAGISFPAAERFEIEEQIAPLLELAGDDVPIALIIDPGAHAMRERRCYFGPMIGTPPVTWRNARNWEWRADVPSLY
jgi:hypothetical protein